MLTSRRLRNTWDRWLVVALLVAANLPLFATHQPNLALVLFPDAVARGEWWRLILHPFVHVSLYHLLLDGVAFVLLLGSLEALSPARRLLIAASAAAGSIVAAGLANGELATYGLCGLSGSAHGLMVASGLLMLQRGERSDRALGLTLVVVVGLKSLFEVATGHVFFESLHLGNIGTPNPLCHLGGVLGALALLLAPRLTPTKLLSASRV
jgi:rhomboid family GlyGly-CTERM serine protease